MDWNILSLFDGSAPPITSILKAHKAPSVSGFEVTGMLNHQPPSEKGCKVPFHVVLTLLSIARQLERTRISVQKKLVVLLKVLAMQLFDFAIVHRANLFTMHIFN
jgi:hypothetical protein